MPVEALPLNAQRGSVMDGRDGDSLPVSPPVNTGVAAATAMHCLRREAEHLVEFGDFRLVRDLVERRFAVRIGMAETAAVADDDAVGVPDHRAKLHVQGEGTEEEIQEESHGKKDKRDVTAPRYSRYPCFVFTAVIHGFIVAHLDTIGAGSVFNAETRRRRGRGDY